MNFILGIANFDKNYGFTNNIEEKYINKILNFNKKKKILEIDTAINYRRANKILSKTKFKNKFKINLKIPKITNNNFKKKIDNYIKNFKKKFGIRKINSLIFHYPKQIFEIGMNEILEYLMVLKKHKKIKQFGFSIYFLSELEEILKISRPDIIQLPLNIFDQRFVDEKILNKIYISNAKIQFRSIFLQGLALHRFNKFKNRKSNQIIKSYWDKLDQENIDPLKNTMMLLSKYKKKGKFIISGDNINQFNQIILNKKIKFTKKRFFNFKTSHENLIIPQLWEKM